MTQEKQPPTGPASCYGGSFLLGVSFFFFSTSSCSLTHVESFQVGECRGEGGGVAQGGASHAALPAAPFL